MGLNVYYQKCNKGDLSSTTAARLGAQRSNVELLCLCTCLNKARELQAKGEDGPQYGNDVWIGHIVQWAVTNKTQALLSAAFCAFLKKYGFALYHNVANDRSFSSLYSSVTYITRHFCP